MGALDFGRVVGFGWSPGFGVWVVGGFSGFESAWSVSSLVFCLIYIIQLILILSIFLPQIQTYIYLYYTFVILAVIKNLGYPLLLSHTFRRYATLRGALQMWVNF